MGAESLAKAYILTHGVRFSPAALDHAELIGAKRQNMVYNLPAADGDAVGLAVVADRDRVARPQELFLTGDDGYTVCVSAVACGPSRAGRPT